MHGSAPPLPGHRVGLRYIPAIDGLRTLAVLSVFVFHLRNDALPGGYVGVDIFFVISGFVVTGSLLNARFSRFRDLIYVFYARRIYRIMPALVVMLMTTIVASAMFIPEAWLSQSIYGVGRAAFLGLSNIVLAAQTDTYFAPRAAYNPFLHTWSLGVEEQFYLLFPFIMWLWLSRRESGRGKRLELGLVAGLSLLSLVACAVLARHAWLYAFYSIPARFWELGTGMLLCLTLDRWRPRLGDMGNGRAAALTAGAIALVAIAFAIPESIYFPFPLAVLPVIGTAGLIALVAARPADRATLVLGSAVPVRIGKLSYSIYLWHWPVIVMLRWTIGVDDWIGIGAAIVATIVLAWLSYTFVEGPVRRLPARFLPDPMIAMLVGIGLVLGCAATARVLTQARGRIALSVTRDTSIWRADATRRLIPAAARCALTVHAQEFAGGDRTVWRPARCRGVRPSGTLYLTGDSHNLAYRPMVLQFAAERGLTVVSYFRSGCPFVALYAPVSAKPLCVGFILSTYNDLLKRLRPHDVLFMPSLRIDRFQRELESAGPGTAPTMTADQLRAAGAEEGRRMVAAFVSTGASVVLEAPLPVFRVSPYLCSDWFNRKNPACRAGFAVESAPLEARRRPVVAVERSIASALPRVTLWDPYPILCPGAVCQAFSHGKPLFFDGDHLSGYGNFVLLPSFAGHVDRVRGGLPSYGSDKP